jgi:peptide/nickel transport system substrate-binding protein
VAREVRRSQRRRVALPLAVSAALAVSACGADPADDPAEGSGDRAEITVSMVEDADTLDPTFGQTLGGRQVFASMCEKLYDIKEAAVVPQLATAAPELSEDGLTATISLREDAVFNDGTPFDAEAVKMTLDRHREHPRSARAGELAPVTEVTVEDEHTVSLTLDKPYAPLAAVLADRAGMILSSAALEEHGDDFGENPVCVAPFTLVERTVGDRIVLEKSDEYYDADEVFIDRVVMRPIPDASVRVANFRSGEIDIIDRIPTPDYSALANDDSIETISTPSFGHDSAVLNVSSGPFQNPAVRQAFARAIDREQLAKTVYGGLYTPACQPFSKDSPFFITDLECPARDADAARAMLEDAGVQTPVAVRLLSLNDTLSTRRAELIQAQAADAGFAVSVEATESGTLINKSAEGDFDAVILTWSGRVDPDGNVAVFQATEGSQNFARASDPQIDTLIEQARSTSDEAERADLYSELWDMAMARGNEVVLAIPVLLVGHQADVEGLEIYGDGLIRLKGVS